MVISISINEWVSSNPLMIEPKLIIGPKCNKLKVYGQNSYNPKVKGLECNLWEY